MVGRCHFRGSFKFLHKCVTCSKKIDAWKHLIAPARPLLKRMITTVLKWDLTIKVFINGKYKSHLVIVELVKRRYETENIRAVAGMKMEGKRARGRP